MNKKLAILLSIVFIDLVGFGVVIPLFPLIVEDAGGGPLLIGVLIGVYSLFQFLFSPILGRLSDKYGRKPVLFWSTLINGCGYLFIFFAPHVVPLLFVGRMLSGIGTANISVVQAYIADTSKSHERTKRLALLGAIFGLGFIVGPFVGGTTASAFHLSTPFIITGVAAFLNVVLIALFLPESNMNLQKKIKIEFFNMKVMREVLQPPNIRFLIFLFFLINLTLALIIGVLPLYSAERFSWGAGENGYFFMAIGIASFLTQALGIRLLLRKYRETRLVKVGMVIFGLANMGIGLALNEGLLILSGAMSAVGFSMMNANLQSLISLESDSTEQGVVLGVAQSLAALARVIGPIIGGVLATWHLNIPYYVSGLAVFVVLAWGFRRLAYGEYKAYVEKS